MKVNHRSEQSSPDLLEIEEALVEAARIEGGVAGKLFDRYYGKISNFIYHSTFDKDLTEDLTSSVFLSAFENLPSYKWRRIPFSAWLFRIASNELKMHFRRNKKAKIVSIDTYLEGPGSLTSDAKNAVQSLVQEEDYRVLHEALEQLNTKYRTVIILRYFEDKTIFEISQILGKRNGTIKSQIHRGLARLEWILVRRGVLRSSEEIQK